MQEGSNFIVGGAVSGTVISHYVGGIGIVGGFGGIGLGLTGLTSIGALSGAAVYGACQALEQGDPTAVGLIGTGMALGIGTNLGIGGVGLAIGGTAFGVGMVPMALTGGVIGLGIYGLFKLLSQNNSATNFSRNLQFLEDLTREYEIKQAFSYLEVEEELKRLKEKINKVEDPLIEFKRLIKQVEANLKEVKTRINQVEEILKDVKTLPEKNSISPQPPLEWQCQKTIKTQAGSLHTITLTPDGQKIVSTGNNQVNLWDLETGKNIFTFIGGSQEEFQTTAISPSGKTLLAGGFNKIISAWDLEKKSLISSLFKHHSQYSHDGLIFSLVFSSDKKWVASGGGDNKIKLWDALTGRLERIFNGHSEAVSAIAISCDSQVLISGSVDKTIRLWNIKSSYSSDILSGHTQKITCLGIDGEYLISGSLDTTIKIWHLPTKQLVKTLTGHLNGVYSLAISPQGDILATAGVREIKLWNLKTGELLEVLLGSYPIVFSSNGDFLVSSSPENNLKIWTKSINKHTVSSLSFSQEWWKILGVKKDATLPEVKLAYRILARQYHPDLNQDPEAITAMQILNYAYENFLNILDKNTNNSLEKP